MLLDSILGLFSRDMGIDLGTANTLVLLKDKGIIINEPSVVAVQNERYGKQRIIAVGAEAKEMLGRTPGDIEAVRPMKDGVIADFDMTEKMIRYFIEKTHKRRFFVSPRIIISVPYGLTQVERKAVRESAMIAGAREVYLIEEPMAAAIGAGLPVNEARGSLVVDIGGGTTEIGVISLGGIISAKSVRVAGDKIDASIVNYVKEKYSLLISERAAEEIKIKIGTAVQQQKDLTYTVKGKDQISGLLSSVDLTSEDVREAIKDSIREIADALKFVLESIQPEVAADIVENGVVLTGGGALIRGLDKYLSDTVKLPVFVADEPLLCVANGTGKALEEIKSLKQAAND
ncbi:MAG: rod shape-determining protein [Campylobacter gracilis]|jgi:cell division protein ftsA|uniref:Cell shape-determining protein MreB n=4 Tax=Campylobacter TaxID=194 RepID=C8PF75_9BACT|nr:MULTISPECIES: rod shape-determining protein [Campylobacter]AKT91755.1 cell wall shape-determining protein [Campylobacter gracilis]EEV18703.1 cell shape determining protein, MreB/Mrl family [Campylobacter gracilis RM3268]MBS6152952.1 rod shape-determining protein [Campylobacter gracilis]RKV97744.1 MAG: rod shape-determining protein [Campylobacter sp.]UEB46036.1 rod shape-determining protein [Campylobacter gracilis]